MMRRICVCAILLAVGAVSMGVAQQRGYAGFDRNDYPGDAALTALHKSFDYTGYWLNSPPGETGNSWAGKRALLRRQGFGFLLLFNGRKYVELKGKDAAALGMADGKDAVAAAAREGFRADVLIFLDQEEGGRLLAEQAAYVFAWADAVRAGGARAGVYCSGIEVPEGKGTISTARDIAERERARTAGGEKGKRSVQLWLWVANDQCPPSPGCSMAAPTLAELAGDGTAQMTRAWQYAQSPRRMQWTGSCPANYAADGKCYAPGMTQSADTFVDLNTADSADPSGGR